MKTILLFVISVLCLVYIYFITRKRKKYPPGPSGLPFIGYLPFLGTNWAQSTFDLSKKYGDIYSLKIGSHDVVILCSGKIMREAHNKAELQARPEEEIEGALCLKSPLITANGTLWRDHRRFTLRTFRNLGLGKTRMNEFTQEEIGRFLRILSAHEGKPFDISEELDRSIIKIISILLFGAPNALGPESIQLLEDISEGIGTHYTLISLYFHWMRKLPFLGKKMINHSLLEKIQSLQALMKKEVEQHKKTLNPSDVRDYIDAYLLELEAKTNGRKETELSEPFLIPSLQLLYGGAKESIRQTMRWIFYTLAAYQDVQSKIHKEIDSAIGRERKPTLSDEANLPVTHAVIMEVLRWRAGNGFNFPRQAQTDVTVGQYTIPKGTYVIANLLAANTNDKEWENPEEFNPYRFLNSDGTSFVNRPDYAPFVSGKRSCPGEGYAMIAIFLYVTSIFQKFTIHLPNGHKPDFGTIRTINAVSPKPHKLVFIRRDGKI